MKWTVRLTVCVVLLFGAITAVGQEMPIEEKVVYKVLEMLHTSPPPSLKIEHQTQAELREWFKGEFVKECVRNVRTQTADQYVLARQICRQWAESLRLVVYGYWEKDAYPKLKIHVWRGAGLRVIVHETLHWWANIHSNGVLDTHAVVDPLVDAILTSQEFQVWLAEQE